MKKHKKPSARQRAILKYIWQYLRDYGRPPVYREIVSAIGVNSTSVVKHHVDKLVAMDLIRREKNVARGLSLTDEALTLLEKFRDTVREATNLVRLPIQGIIVAGEPVNTDNDSFATLDEEDTIVVDGDLLPRNRDDVFAMRVSGYSMIDALVSDRDIVILQRISEANEVRDGNMVAAWLQLEQELTLKRFYREGKKVRLQPENPNFKPIITPGANVEVQGKVILVQRQMAGG